LILTASFIFSSSTAPKRCCILVSGALNNRASCCTSASFREFEPVMLMRMPRAHDRAPLEHARRWRLRRFDGAMFTGRGRRAITAYPCRHDGFDVGKVAIV